MFEAKRLSTESPIDFALDDVSVPTVDCTNAPLYPVQPFSYATGE